MLPGPLQAMLPKLDICYLRIKPRLVTLLLCQLYINFTKWRVNTTLISKVECVLVQWTACQEQKGICQSSSALSKSVDSSKPFRHEKSTLTCMSVFCGHSIYILLCNCITCSLGDKTFVDIAAENAKILLAITTGQILWIFHTMNWYKPVEKMRVLHVPKETI